jgi:hypothetical protein
VRKKSAVLDAFLETIAPDRRKDAATVWNAIRRYVPAGYEEAVVKTTLVYQVPLAAYGDTYNGRAMWLVGLASQKSYLSLHLLPLYVSPPLVERLAEDFRAAGKKLRCGKACINFSAADDLALDAIGGILASMPMDRWIEMTRRG